jgi:hypothetical protein
MLVSSDFTSTWDVVLGSSGIKSGLVTKYKSTCTGSTYLVCHPGNSGKLVEGLWPPHK